MKFGSYINEVKEELKSYLDPPRTKLNSLIVNAFISLGFFLISLALGSVNSKVLPIAATVILLWTLADASITNQFTYDKDRIGKLLKKHNDLKQVLIIRNLAIVVLSIPLSIIFGLLMVAIIGKWSELLYGLVMALALVWGWLGISNVLSIYLPFDHLQTKQIIKREKGWFRYSFLYVLPWIILPFYSLVILIPLKLLNIITGYISFSHILSSSIIVLFSSLIIWYIGLNISANASHRINHIGAN